MGRPTGFFEYDRKLPARRPVPVQTAGLARGVRVVPRGRSRPPRGALHGLRHPVLPRRMPTREPHPGVERPRVPRRLARGSRAAARHQQLPGVHRAAVPGPVRGRLRAGHQLRSGHDRAHRVRDRRAGLERGLGHPGRPVGAHGQIRGGGGVGALGPGLCPAAGPRRTQRRRVRAGGAPRWAAALRDPRVQDGEGRARPPPGTTAGRGCGLPLRHRGRRVRRRRPRLGGGAGAGPASRARRGVGPRGARGVGDVVAGGVRCRGPRRGRHAATGPARATGGAWPGCIWRWTT